MMKRDPSARGIAQLLHAPEIAHRLRLPLDGNAVRFQFELQLIKPVTLELHFRPAAHLFHLERRSALGHFESRIVRRQADNQVEPKPQVESVIRLLVDQRSSDLVQRHHITSCLPEPFLPQLSSPPPSLPLPASAQRAPSGPAFPAGPQPPPDCSRSPPR